MYAIEVDNISKCFGKGRHKFRALDNVSLKVKQGEIYGLLGPNGAGKSTLIHILANILKPDRGSAKILGLDATSEKEKLGKRMNVCFGNSHFFSAFSPRKILTYYAMLYNIPRRAAVEKIDELSESLKFKHYIDREFMQLSKGMKQKIALAKALINDPEVLLLDEPTVGLDVDVANEIRDIFKGLAEEKNVSILLTSHYMGEVETLCKKITLLNKGRVIREGSIADIKNSIKAPDSIYLVLDNYDNISFVKRIRGVMGYELIEDRLKVLSKFSEDTIEPLLKAMRKNRKKVVDLEIRNTSLEDAFIKLVRK